MELLPPTSVPEVTNIEGVAVGVARAGDEIPACPAVICEGMAADVPIGPDAANGTMVSIDDAGANGDRTALPERVPPAIALALPPGIALPALGPSVPAPTAALAPPGITPVAGPIVPPPIAAELPPALTGTPGVPPGAS